MTTHDLWSDYASCWSAPPPARRATLERCASPDVSYRDPGTEVRGLDGLAGYMAGFSAAFPGHRFEITAVDAHHDRSLARWHQLDADGQPVASGISHAAHDHTGRLHDISGFFPVT